MKSILEHRPGIPPTQLEIKQAIIQRLLDVEYPPEGLFYKRDKEGWDQERQVIVLRMGWNTMSVFELLNSLNP